MLGMRANGVVLTLKSWECKMRPSSRPAWPWLREGNSLGFCPISLDSARRWCGLWALLWQLALNGAQYKLPSSSGNAPLSVAMGLPSASFQVERTLCSMRQKAAQGRALGAQTVQAGGSAWCREAGGAPGAVLQEQRVKSCRHPAWELAQSPSFTRGARGCGNRHRGSRVWKCWENKLESFFPV